MDDIQELVKTTLSEVERILSTKTVVGEPITVEGNIFIPLVMMGFGFGGGGMARKGTAREGGGTGIGGGGAVKPVAVVVIAKDGSIRVEPTHGTIVPIADRIMEVVNKAIDRRWPREESGQKGE